MFSFLIIFKAICSFPKTHSNRSLKLRSEYSGDDRGIYLLQRQLLQSSCYTVDPPIHSLGLKEEALFLQALLESLSAFFGPHTTVCSLCLKWKISVTQYPALIPTDSQVSLSLFFFLLVSVKIWLHVQKRSLTSQPSQQIHKHGRFKPSIS